MTYAELRRIREILPHESTHSIADELLDMDEGELCLLSVLLRGWIDMHEETTPYQHGADADKSEVPTW